MSISKTNNSNKKEWVKLLLGGCISLGCLLIFFEQINISEVLNAFSNFNWIYLLAGLLSLVFDFTFRAFRWSLMLRFAGAIVTTKDCLTPYLSSMALNNILPFRLGDVIRATVFPKYLGITKTLATGSLIIERLVDFMTLLLVFIIGLLVIDNLILPEKIYMSLLFVSVIGCIIFISALCFSGIFKRFFTSKALALNTKKSVFLFRICDFLAKLFLSFEVMLHLKSLFLILILSMIIWGWETLFFYILLYAVGLEFSFLMASFVMAMTTLSTLIPSSPGYVGTFHLATFTAMSLLGATSGQAGGYAVIVHLVLWLSINVAGLLAILLKPNFFREAKSQIT